MRRYSADDILLKALGLLLLTAAVLKGHELLTVPVANRGLWTWRPFLIFQVEFELALGLWLLSGLFKRLAWLASLTCFSLFCCVTLYKGLTGAASCGCFGTVHVNPWATLLTIDLPAVVALALFHPPLPFASVLSFLRRQESIQVAVGCLLRPMPSLPRFTATAVLGLVLLSLTTPILAFHRPPTITAKYEVLEPETWVGRELPILEYIDIADQLKQGTWLLLFYHHDCPDCQKAVPRYQQMVHSLLGKEGFPRLAFVEIPPCGPSPLCRDLTAYALGRLADVKEWFATTPIVALMVGGKVRAAWEAQAPDPQIILAEYTSLIEEVQAIRIVRQQQREREQERLAGKGGEMP